jgi:cupin superfamily acireductone dioxygenase involved in methionine salvage
MYAITVFRSSSWDDATDTQVVALRATATAAVAKKEEIRKKYQDKIDAIMEENRFILFDRIEVSADWVEDVA